MGLPSQTPRVAAVGRTFVRTHHRRRSPVKRVGLMVLLFVAVIVGAWYVVGFHKGEPGSHAGDPSSSQEPSVLEEPYGTNRSSSSPSPSVQASTAGAGRAQPMSSNTLPSHQVNEPIVINQASNQHAQPGSRSLAEALNQTRPVARNTPTADRSSDTGEVASSLETPARVHAPTPSIPAPVQGGVVARALKSARLKIDAGDPVAARSILNSTLLQKRLSADDQATLRRELTTLNEQLIFSDKVIQGDPLTDTYTIVRGDRLSKLPGKLGLAVDWHLLARINHIADPNKIRLGQKLKVVRGPFHAVVHKEAYRVDVFAGPPEDPSQWVYIRSFRVGLGAGNSTPTGHFVVKKHSKLINPYWVNPRTGEKFDADDPNNPIGERWIGIEGIGDDAVKTGFGLHGTIEPESIGQQKSMGCVRLRDDDIDLMYGLLVEGISRVEIVE